MITNHSQRYPLPIKFANLGAVALIPEFGIDIVTYEIEKGRELGIKNSRCCFRDAYKG